MQLEDFRQHRRRKKRPIQRSLARNPISVVGGSATVGGAGASSAGMSSSSSPSTQQQQYYFYNYSPWYSPWYTPYYGYDYYSYGYNRGYNGYPWAYWGWPMGFGYSSPYYQPLPPFPQYYAPGTWPPYYSARVAT
jgi:hypothetical protein